MVKKHRLINLIGISLDLCDILSYNGNDNYMKIIWVEGIFMEEDKNLKSYSKPEVIQELDIEIRAGSPLFDESGPFFDIFKE